MRLPLAPALLAIWAASASAQTFNIGISGTGLGTGRGFITSSPSGINCTFYNGDILTGACSFAFPANSSVTLTAAVDPNVAFSWTGACSSFGSSPTCTLSMTQDRVVGGNFVPTASYPITMTMTGNGYGSIASADFRNPPVVCSQSGANITCQGSRPATSKLILEVDSPQDKRSRWRGWGGACAGVQGPSLCTVFLDGPKTITGGFDVPSLQITKIGGGGSGTVTSTRGKINCTIGPGGTAGTCSAPYETFNDRDTLIASPAQGTVFGQWSGGCTVTSPICGVIVLDYPTTVGIAFSQEGYLFTVKGEGSGSGTVSGTKGINCTITKGVTSGSCIASQVFGDAVSYTASPAAGSRFGSWTGGCTGSNPTCNITASQTTTVTARFETDNGAIFVTGTGSGTITSQPAGISCTLTNGTTSGNCSGSYLLGTDVTLSASPAQDFTFTGWGGKCAGTGTCAFKVDQDYTITANFTRPPIALTVGGVGNGTGTITSSPDGINCSITGSGSSGDCSTTFAGGSTVTLTANPTQQSTFQNWAGDCTGTTPTCQVTMSAPRSVTANFKGLLVDLSLAGFGSGDGIVKSDVGGMNCKVTKGTSAGAGCIASVSSGASVKLTADPQNGSTFGGWTSGGCTGTSLTCTLSVSQAGSVGARFTAPQTASQIADALLGGTAPSADEAAQLDRFGNHDGVFNLGDLIALLDRTGEKLSPAIISAIIEAEQSRHMRSSPRRPKP